MQDSGESFVFHCKILSSIYRKVSKCEWDSQYRVSACMPVGSMISGGCSSTNTWQCFKSRLDIVIGKLRLESNCPGRFKLTGAWCEELLSQMKHIFLFCFPKELELLRTQIQLQAAEISKLQTENQKLQATVPVTYHLISPLGTKHSCWALGSFLPTPDLYQHTSARSFISVKWSSGWYREILSEAGGDLTAVSALWGHCS